LGEIENAKVSFFYKKAQHKQDIFTKMAKWVDILMRKNEVRASDKEKGSGDPHVHVAVGGRSAVELLRAIRLSTAIEPVGEGTDAMSLTIAIVVRARRIQTLSNLLANWGQIAFHIAFATAKRKGLVLSAGRLEVSFQVNAITITPNAVVVTLGRGGNGNIGIMQSFRVKFACQR
jgi:hypothetical protein